MSNLLTAAKAALEALETCDWNDNDFPDDTQYFDRFAVSEAATKLRAAIADAEKQEPVAWIDPAFRNGREDKLIYIPRPDGTSVPLYLHPADSSCDHRYVTTFGGDYCAKCNEPAPSNDHPTAPTVPKIAG